MSGLRRSFRVRERAGYPEWNQVATSGIQVMLMGMRFEEKALVMREDTFILQSHVEKSRCLGNKKPPPPRSMLFSDVKNKTQGETSFFLLLSLFSDLKRKRW